MMEQSDKSVTKQSSSRIPPFPRDRRDSLEVFKPSSSSFFTEKPTDLPFPSEPKWKSWLEPHNTHEPEPAELFSFDTGQTSEITNNISWMALGNPSLTTQSSSPLSQQTFSAFLNDAAQKSPSSRHFPGEVGTAALRAAEWGLVLKTDRETGQLQGVSFRNSGGEEPGSRVPGTSRRDSNNSFRSSEDTLDDAGKEIRGIPRISEDLKDALSAFQQTFVVCDATKPDYPIMYASAGFFKLTGYTRKEAIGRNCRFLQGAGTDPEDVAKIRGALEAGTSYCGRLLNYKKDGTPFWNLLTLSPIKDDSGKILKIIGMQVEVSKHTEGSKEKMLRPNGLPGSLIRYDARQKEKAVSSVSELLQAMKRPRALSESANPPLMIRKSEGGEKENLKAGENLSRRRSESVASFRQKAEPEITSMQPITEVSGKKLKNSRRISFMGYKKKSQSSDESFEKEIVAEGSSENEDEERADIFDDLVVQREKRRGLDLATTLERIEKNFVITDPRLPDNPIIFASDSFLELTEYSREEILGRNCRFLQGPETDSATVRKIREAIDNQTEVTVQLINYTKSGKKFWNLFHLQPMRDQKGEVQYFIGVQLDGSRHVEPLKNSIAHDTAVEGEKLVKQTAENVDDAVRELPDANLTPEDLWMNHSKLVHPKPHRKNDPAWEAVRKILESGEEIGLKHFRPIKPLGSGDTGSVHLVELRGTGQYFAMKVMDKSEMLNRNKVQRACTERVILDMLDHPFLPALYASFQTKTHVCLITDYCAGGELFLLLDRQPKRVLKEDAVRFYAAEVVVALEYLHCQGIIYRDLKPENVLLQRDGHVALTDFDLSCLTSCRPQLLIPAANEKKKKRKMKGQADPVFLAEPVRASNSFVGTEEYIAPEIITGSGHTSAVDWWTLGILLYEMLYGCTPFRGKTRQKTFTNILHKNLKFPRSRPVSLHAKQLMYRLLHRDPKNRLGSQEGSNEIKRHPFFRGVNWALVRSMNPPKLDAPLFEKTEGENEALDGNPALEDLETNVF